jgi:hypothetical protein
MGGFDQIDDQIFVIDDQNDQNDRIRRFEVKPFTLEARIYFIMNPSIPANYYYRDKSVFTGRKPKSNRH